MNSVQMRQMCQKQVDDVVDIMHDLCAQGRFEDADALYSEISDWVVQGTENEVLSLDYIRDQLEND